MALVVGIDVATAEVRAAAFDGAGAEHARATAPLPPPTSPRPGWVEQDAGSWWPAAVAAVAGVTARLGDRRRAVVAVAVCSTSATVVVLDPAGRPTHPALTWADQRAVAEAAVAREAGVARWARLGLRVQPSSGLAKLAWLVGRPGGGAGAGRLAHPADVVGAGLVGAPVPCDWSHALKSGYDPGAGEWAGEAMDALGVPARLLPPVAPPATPAGTVGPMAAAATGLPPGCRVHLGMTDACAAQLAAGAGSPGRWVSVLGTTLVLKGASRHPLADPAGAVYSHRHPGGWWLPGGASSTGAGALPAGFAGRSLADLDRRAARHGPARTVAYPLVGRGERFPFVAPDAEGFTVGGGGDADEVERYRATLEGVAFVERLGYERLRALGATVAGPVAAAGGGSASAVWNAIRASVLGLGLVAVAGATTVRGAAVLAAAGTLHADVEAATAAMAATGRRVDPDPAAGAAMEDGYRRFVAALVERGWLDGPGAGAVR